MSYRTKTYIAGDWTDDQELISQLYKWNKNDYWSLHFIDAHALKQANDTSLPCTIKDSLSDRLNVSKTFVLIVGEHTKNLTQGSCQYCNRYNGLFHNCSSGYIAHYESYVEYECKKAVRDGLKIVVIYNSTEIVKIKCPECIRACGVHICGQRFDQSGNLVWNYSEIKDAIMY